METESLKNDLGVSSGPTPTPSPHFEIHRDVIHGQWKGTTFVLHIGTTAYVWVGRKPRDYGAVLQICTPKRWFRFSRSKCEPEKDKNITSPSHSHRERG